MSGLTGYLTIANLSNGTTERQSISEKEVAERIIIMERLFNVREGITRKDDTLPDKVGWEEIATGPFKGHRVPPEKLEELLDTYYELRGWDKNGIPRRDRLEHLGFGEYAP
jgi:aldehyde:ferredoxin oxidoreductase